MINERELMIGNWYSFFNGYGEPEKALQFDLNEFRRLNECITMPDFFEPIPLMAQHFISAGFVWHGTRLCYPKITIDAWGIHDFTFKLGEIHIEYLHQLQNIVRILTGEELEIKL